jgi:glycerate kinase
VLVAPDAFAGTLSAPEAAHAMAEGWRRHAPDDELTSVPMSDGGPGFVDVLHDSLGGDLEVVTVAGPQGRPTPVTLLLRSDTTPGRRGDTAYVESAQACGHPLLDAPDAWHTSTLGVGQTISAAVDAGATTVVVGLGGSATHDGGAGLLSALGATADVPLDRGPSGLRGVTGVDLTAARERLEGVELVAAIDVDTTLLGMFGATKTYGPQKGLSDDDILVVDRILDELVVAACGPTPAERRMADRPGAGAAGGLGFALMLLGADTRPGVELVVDSVGLASAATEHDLLVTGEGTYDHQSRSGKVVHGVARTAAAAARPCIVLAGQVTVGSREMRAMGVESAYAAADLIGLEQSFADPHGSLASLAERVARTWSPQRG